MEGKRFTALPYFVRIRNYRYNHCLPDTAGDYLAESRFFLRLVLDFKDRDAGVRVPGIDPSLLHSLRSIQIFLELREKNFGQAGFEV